MGKFVYLRFDAPADFRGIAFAAELLARPDSMPHEASSDCPVSTQEKNKARKLAFLLRGSSMRVNVKPRADEAGDSACWELRDGPGGVRKRPAEGSDFELSPKGFTFLLSELQCRDGLELPVVPAIECPDCCQLRRRLAEGPICVGPPSVRRNGDHSLEVLVRELKGGRQIVGLHLGPVISAKCVVSWDRDRQRPVCSWTTVATHSTEAATAPAVTELWFNGDDMRMQTLARLPQAVVNGRLLAGYKNLSPDERLSLRKTIVRTLKEGESIDVLTTGGIGELSLGPTNAAELNLVACPRVTSGLVTGNELTSFVAQINWEQRATTAR